jgi:competence ComEA-like helix-hairpin-helix protein
LVYLNVSENFQETETIQISRFDLEPDSKSYQETSYSNSSDEKEDASLKSNSKGSERFNFDPNGLSEKDWRRLGLTDKQIRTIKNYESKGGKFKKKEDLKKMYSIKNELYESLEQYIKISSLASDIKNEKVLISEVKDTKKPVLIPTLLDLNSADSAMLTTIKGIGPFFAKTIIKYRNSLGGFYAKEQLMEVWKFDREKFDMVEKFLIVDPLKIKKININTCEAEHLKSPYIKWNVANAIVNYRKQHGKFKTIDEITKTDLVDEETLRKIAPYLTVE